MIRFFARPVLFFPAVAVAGLVQAAEKNDPYFGCDDDVTFAVTLRQSMSAANLVGENAIKV